MGQNTTYLTPALKAGNSGNPIDFFLLSFLCFMYLWNFYNEHMLFIQLGGKRRKNIVRELN